MSNGCNILHTVSLLYPLHIRVYCTLSIRTLERAAHFNCSFCYSFLVRFSVLQWSLWLIFSIIYHWILSRWCRENAACYNICICVFVNELSLIYLTEYGHGQSNNTGNFHVACFTTYAYCSIVIYENSPWIIIRYKLYSPQWQQIIIVSAHCRKNRSTESGAWSKVV